MTFPDALSAVFNDGDLVTRDIWYNKAEVGLDDGKLCINGYQDDKGQWVGDGKWRAWIVTEQDYFSDDWQVVE